MIFCKKWRELQYSMIYYSPYKFPHSKFKCLRESEIIVLASENATTGKDLIQDF